MLFAIRSFFLIIAFGLLGSCQKAEDLYQGFSSAELEFMESQDPEAQKEIFEKSHIVYKGSPICSQSKECRSICKTLFLGDEVQDHCRELPSQQIFQIEKLYQSVSQKNFLELQNANIFDLKVLFNLSSAPLFEFFKTLDSVSVKKFLIWIVENWQVAFIFQQEDQHFLFLEIFLNKLNQFPINSLKEKLEEDRTFMEWAWLKNNDHVLFWLDDYFHQKVCEAEPESETPESGTPELRTSESRTCVLSQYCSISQSFGPEVRLEFLKFDRLKDLLQTEDLQTFCLN